MLRIYQMDNLKVGKKIEGCHMCKSKNLVLVLDLGHHPHSDDFLEKERLDDAETLYPLRLVTCSDCGLLQIDYLVNPDILYRTNYVYESSTTKTGREHYTEMAKQIVDKFNIPKGSLAVDIGSNVGVLLQGFKNVGMKVLGVDPAEIPANKAIDNGIDTVIDYFTKGVAENIVKKHGHAHVITGTNVFAHLHEIDDAVEGMKVLLDKDGVIAIEAPYATPLVEHLEYDTIYHQHVGYLSVKPMQEYFERFDLELFDVKPSSIHGGTLRYYVGHTGAHPVAPAVTEYISKEKEFGLYDTNRLKLFAKNVEEQRISLLDLLRDLKKQGKSIIGISTPAKGNTLLNYCNIDTTYLDYATEKAKLKVGKYTPGTHIPIYDDEKILQDMPDYALILAWNFADEIMKNMVEYKKRGGKFIIPIPKPIIK